MKEFMMLGTVQLCKETITHLEAKDICSSLKSHDIRILSLRECKIQTEDFQRLMRAAGLCGSLMQLNLNVGVVTTSERVEMLAKALTKNRSITALFLHGSQMGDKNLSLLMKALSVHPSIVSLDLGDCQLGDYGVEMICDLLPPDGAKPGLKELSLSGNPAITSHGWAKLFLAMAAGCTLKALYLDYNGLGNYGAGCLAVALASCPTMEVVDLEETGITDHGAQVILHLVQNFPNSLKHINLSGNDIRPRTLEKIKQCLIAALSRNEEESTIESTDGPEDSELTGSEAAEQETQIQKTESVPNSESEAISLLVAALNRDDSLRTVPMVQKQESNAEAGSVASEIVASEAEESKVDPKVFWAPVFPGDDSAVSSLAPSECEEDSNATVIIHEEEAKELKSENLETVSGYLNRLDNIGVDSEDYGTGDEDDDDDDDDDDEEVGVDEEEPGDLLTEVPVPQTYEVVRSRVVMNKSSYNMMVM